MFVNRNEQGVIVALYANQQYDGQEWLDDDSDELVAFLTPAPTTPADPVTKLKDFLAANPDVAALLGA
jgi:hypothetical protein